MLSEARAERLARRAARCRRDGGRGPLARRAWQRLTEAGDGGDQNAVGAVWQAWLSSPHDELWQALARWREPGELAGAAFMAVVEPGRAAGDRAAIGAFCARRSLAPAAETERAVFYVLTGQAAQHRAADPDGSLLAAAYQQADGATRAAVRAAVAGVGQLDLVRVIAGSGVRRRIADLTPREREYLVGQLVDRRDWAGLWRLTTRLPLADAVTAARHMGDGWSPPDEEGRRLLRLLTQATPQEVAAVAAEAVARVELVARGSGVRAIRLAPDGSQLVTISSGVRSQLVAVSSGMRLYDVSTGRSGANDPSLGHRTLDAVHMGAAVLCLERASGRHAQYQYRVTMDVQRPGPFVFWRGRESPVLAHFRDGLLVVVTHDGVRPVWPQLSPRLYHSTLADFGLGGGEIINAATEPASGRLAILSWHKEDGEIRLTVVGSHRTTLGVDLRVISSARAGPTGAGQVGFLGPDRLCTRSRRGRFDQIISSWRAGPPLAVEAESEPMAGRDSMTLLPHAGLVAFVPFEGGAPDPEGRQTPWLDAETLTAVDRPPAFRLARLLTVAADRAHVAVLRQEEHGVEVHDLRLRAVDALLARPIAGARPADLRIVATAEALDLRPEIMKVIGLLRACLEYR